MFELKQGMKVRVLAGDRDTVMFDPYGEIRTDDKYSKYMIYFGGVCCATDPKEFEGQDPSIIVVSEEDYEKADRRWESIAEQKKKYLESRKEMG